MLMSLDPRNWLIVQLNVVIVPLELSIKLLIVRHMVAPDAGLTWPPFEF